ncbi:MULTISPECIES: hypothetical protein [Thermus]|uniref:hypothetical protein n=1 Tax=Thermus brockianus TaxID=56956 RepID=UPI001F409023|nr:hypothetical protein [Thermus brockianus]
MLGVFFALGVSLSIVRWEPAIFDLALPLVVLLGYKYFVWRTSHVVPFVLLGLFVLSHLPSLLLAFGGKHGGLVPVERVVYYTLVTLYLVFTSFFFMGLEKKAFIYFGAGYLVGSLSTSLLGILAFIGVPGL